MFGTGYYDKKREKNIGFNVKEFVDDFVTRRNTLEETKTHMYGTGKISQYLAFLK